MKSDVYFDIIPLTLPSIHNEDEFKTAMAKGIYNWLFDKDLKKKIGHIIPGHDGLMYNYVNPDDGDYMLNIQINKDIMKINVNHIDKSKNKINTIYSVESNVGTVGEKMILFSVPIEDFEKYLTFAIDLKCEYFREAKVAVVDNIIDKNQEEIASKLSKLKGMTIE